MKIKCLLIMTSLLLSVLITGLPVTASPGIDDVIDNHYEELMAIEGVTAVTTLEYEGVPTIIVFVNEDAVAEAGRIPEELDGYPVMIEFDYEIDINITDDNEDVPEGTASTADDETAAEEEAVGPNFNVIFAAAVAVALVVMFIIRLRKGS